MILRIIVFLSILTLFTASARGQEPRAPTPDAVRVQQLYDAGNFEAVLALLPPPDDYPANIELYRGLALARRGRWREARAAFRAGGRKKPHNARFAEELAGTEYELKNFGAAKSELHRALALSPGDEYAPDFLGTIYLLEGNLDAALANWNRLGKPEIAAIRMQPEPRLRNDLLERAFAVTPLSVLKLDDLRTTRARLDNLGIFQAYSFTLSPVLDSASAPNSSVPSGTLYGTDGSSDSRSSTTESAKAANSGSSENSKDAPQKFALDFQSLEREEWRGRPLYYALSALRGLPYLTVNPEFYNLGHAARNFVSLLRWDDNKRRVFVSFSEPLDLNPRWRLTLAADARNENWNLPQTFHPGDFADTSATVSSSLNMETLEVAPRLRRVASWRWFWETGPAFSYRRFRDVGQSLGAAKTFFTNSTAVEYRASTTYQILDDPERRLTLGSFARGSFGRNFARGLGGFASLRGGIDLHWIPRATGDDYETNFQLRAGKWFGAATLDELYQLGIERDSNLWLHGIAGTRGGRKGNAPLGRAFLLVNWETDKKVYDNGLVDVSLGPLLDAGRIADPSARFGSAGGLWDVGAALKLRVLRIVGVQLSYGRDIPTGAHALYAAPLR